MPIIGFKNDRSLKNHLVWAVLPPRLMQKTDRNHVGEPSCEVCQSIDDTSHFEERETDKRFDKLKGLLDHSSNHIIYLFECKQCQYPFPYVGSTKTKFWYKINNY